MKSKKPILGEKIFRAESKHFLRTISQPSRNFAQEMHERRQWGMILKISPKAPD